MNSNFRGSWIKTPNFYFLSQISPPHSHPTPLKALGIVGEEGRKVELGDLKENVIQKLKISIPTKIKVGVFSHSLTLRLGYVYMYVLGAINANFSGYSETILSLYVG